MKKVERWLVLGITDVRKPGAAHGVSLHDDKDRAEAFADRKQDEDRHGYLYMVVEWFGQYGQPEPACDDFCGEC